MYNKLDENIFVLSLPIRIGRPAFFPISLSLSFYLLLYSLHCWEKKKNERQISSPSYLIIANLIFYSLGEWNRQLKKIKTKQDKNK